MTASYTAALPHGRASHWTEGKEQVTSSRPIYFLIFCARHLPLWLVGVGVLMTSAVYYVFSKRARSECRRYQKHMINYLQHPSYTQKHEAAPPSAAIDGAGVPHGERGAHPAGGIKHLHIFRQITSFALCVTEKVEGWLGRINYEDVTFHDDDVAELKAQLGGGRGAFLICSHLGNTEVLRSLAAMGHTGVDRKVTVTILMEKNATNKFNRAIDEMSQGVHTEVIAVDNIEPDTIVTLMERIEAGGMVVAAGDRTPLGGRHRLLKQRFMGETALFPYGTFLLSALMKADTYFFFALRKKDFMWYPKYDMYVHKAGVTFDGCPRYEREARVNALCDEFARLLEKHCVSCPYQWYNFYDFWAKE